MSEKHMAHTAGPWVADAEDVLPGEIDVEPNTSRLNGGYIIARLSGPDRKANARLVAAAPALLAFAKSLVDDYMSENGMESPKYIVKHAAELVALATTPGAIRMTTKDAAPRLQPCPFCTAGGRETSESDADYPSKRFMFIQCTRCGARTASIYGSGDPSEWADARSNWNMRLSDRARNAPAQGMVMVPREPTEKMIEAICSSWRYRPILTIRKTAGDYARDDWAAALAASPGAASGAGKEGEL